MGDNFEFLKENYEKLYKDCVNSENLLNNHQYDFSILRATIAIDIMIKLACEISFGDAMIKQSSANRLSALINSDVMPSDFKRYFERIDIIKHEVNQGMMEASLSQAEEIHKYLVEIAKWFNEVK